MKIYVVGLDTGPIKAFCNIGKASDYIDWLEANDRDKGFVDDYYLDEVELDETPEISEPT